MIDATKKYTYKDKLVRIYADGSDTAHGYIHCAVNDDGWRIATLTEDQLVEVWEPTEGALCYFWDNTQHGCHVGKFVKHTTEGYADSNNTYWAYCAPFTGTLPEVFKGLA